MKYKDNNNRFFGFLAIFLATIFWAINGNVGAFLFANKEVTPEHLVTIRLVVSGLIQLSIHKFDKEREFFGIFRDKKDIINLLIFAFGGILLMQYAYFITVKYSNAATAVTLQQFAPFFILILSAIVARKIPSIKTIIALILALSGGFLIVTHGNINSLAVSKMALISAFFATMGGILFNIAPGPIQSKHGVIQVNGWSMLIAGLTLGLVKQPWKIPFIVDPASLAGISYVAIFGTFVPFIMYMTGAQILGPSIASILSLLETVFSTIIATTFMGVDFIILDFIGIGLVIVALFLIMLPIRSTRPEDQL